MQQPTTTNNAKQPEPSTMQVLCAHAQEPSATALRIIVEQAQLRRSMPGVPWTRLLVLLTVCVNIVVWRAMWHVVTGDSSSDENWSSRTLQRQMVIPQAGSVNGSWSFPTSMTPPRR